MYTYTKAFLITFLSGDKETKFASHVETYCLDLLFTSV